MMRHNTFAVRLGKGGSSDVYEVSSKRVKKILREYKNKYFYDRFINEIEILNQLKGQLNVIKIFESNVPSFNNIKRNQAYYIMERGITLDSYVQEISDPLLIVKLVYKIVVQLEILHEKNIFHRDIKPRNIIVVSDVPKLADFSISSFPGQILLTKKNSKIGSAYYISPEAISWTEKLDQSKIDVYGIGKLIWVIITGQNYPLPGEHLLGYEQFSIKSYRTTELADSIDYIIHHSTKMNPNERYTISQLKSELEIILNERHFEVGPLDLSDLKTKLEINRRINLESEDLKSNFEKIKSDLFSGLDKAFRPILTRVQDVIKFENILPIDGKSYSALVKNSFKESTMTQSKGFHVRLKDNGKGEYFILYFIIQLNLEPDGIVTIYYGFQTNNTIEGQNIYEESEVKEIQTRYNSPSFDKSKDLICDHFTNTFKKVLKYNLDKLGT